MKKQVFMDDSRLVEKGVSVLIRELGPVETRRFLALVPAKRQESVKRHRSWQSKLEKEKFFDEVFGTK